MKSYVIVIVFPKYKTIQYVKPKNHSLREYVVMLFSGFSDAFRLQSNCNRAKQRDDLSLIFDEGYYYISHRPLDPYENSANDATIYSLLIIGVYFYFENDLKVLKQCF